MIDSGQINDDDKYGKLKKKSDASAEKNPDLEFGTPSMEAFEDDLTVLEAD